jgi:hypothetical protein
MWHENLFKRGDWQKIRTKGEPFVLEIHYEALIVMDRIRPQRVR